jgi:uncharacterized protein (TIGR00255 family)
MIRSMTGFGRSQSSFEGVDLTVEVNAVNRRNLEISVSLPREWQALEREVQALLRGLFSRGKLHVSILAVPAVSEAGFQWDAQGLEASLLRLGEVAYRHGIGWPPTAESLVRLAALNKVDMRLPDPEAIGALVMAEARKAAKALLLMREAEGAALGADLGERIAALARSMANIGRLSSESVPRYREVLFQRLSQAGLELDPGDERVLKEIALFADKCDISEEQIRLDSHFGQFRECLAEGSPVGRKLEFILQEINREFNTIGSKAGHIEISREVIEAKNEIERIREQLQNIE